MELNIGITRSNPTSMIIAETIKKSSINNEFTQKLSIFEKGIITSDSPDVDKAIYANLMPHDRIPWDLYTLVYERSSLVYNAINNTADFGIQAGYDFETSNDAKKKILEWIDKVNFDLIMTNILKQLMIYGNSYLDISNIDFPKLLPPKTMYVRVQKGGENDGKILGYTQILSGTQKIDLELETVIHFKINDCCNNFYGMSELKPVLGSLTRYTAWTENLGAILQHYAEPMLHHKVGTDEVPTTEEKLDAYIRKLNSRNVGEDWVTSGAVDIKVIQASQGMMQVDNLVRSLQDEIIAGLRIPEIFARGGVNANKSIADTEMQAFYHKVKALLTIASVPLEDFLFPKLTKGKVKMIWNEFSVEGELVRAQRMQLMVDAGVPLPTVMKMIGWGTWLDDVEKDREVEDARNLELQKQQTALMPKTPIKPTKPAK